MTDEVLPPKINNASISELKTTSDDAIAPYMKSLDYRQSHLFSNVRLLLGYSAVITCAAAAYYEYKVGFKQAKSISMLGVGTYFLLNAALYLWGYYIEQDIVYIGTKGDITVEIAASAKKYDPTYRVVFRAYLKKDYTNVAHISTSKSFAAWFDEEGTFVKKPFDNWLGDNVIEVEKQLTSGKKKKN